MKTSRCKTLQYVRNVIGTLSYLRNETRPNYKVSCDDYHRSSIIGRWGAARAMSNTMWPTPRQWGHSDWTFRVQWTQPIPGRTHPGVGIWGGGWFKIPWTDDTPVMRSRGLSGVRDSTRNVCPHSSTLLGQPAAYNPISKISIQKGCF